MINEIRYRAAHRRLRFGRITEGKLERWYGGDVMDSLHLAASGCSVPIPIMGVPAAAYRGQLVGYPKVADTLRRLFGNERGGFTSLSDLIAEGSGGKAQTFPFNKVGTTGIVSGGQSLWAVGNLPAAGSFGAAPAGGTTFDRTSTGAVGQQNPSGGDTLHLTTFSAVSTVSGSLMLMDRLFAAQTAANPGTGAVSISGTQNRYTGSAGTATYAAGNVIIPLTSSTLAATAHNLTYAYTDQDNNGGASSGAVAGRSAAAIGQIDLTAGLWAAPFAAGDTGVRQIESVTFSASPATGQVDHTLARPLAICPTPAANNVFVLDGINSAFNLVRIIDNACLAYMEFFKAATTAATVSGSIQLVAG